MAYKSLLFAALLVSVAASAQNTPLGATTGLGPGDKFSLFVTFQDPMPKIDSMGCAFNLTGNPQPGQEDFSRQVRCSGLTKDDDKHYHMQVVIPSDGIAGGDYKLVGIDLSIGSASRHYEGKELPDLAPVPITNHEHIKFSDIKKLETQK